MRRIKKIIYKVKAFFAKLKEKIIDAAKKIIQWFTEKLTIITTKIEDKKRSKISNKYSKDEIKSVLSEIVPKYLESHKYYSAYADGLNSALMNAVRDYTTGSNHASVKDIMSEYDVSKKRKDELISTLVSMIDSNNTIDDLKKDINDTKKWRDETIDAMGKLLKDNTFSSTSDYHKSCAIAMNIYMAGLKMRLENSKARIDLINQAEKALSKGKDDQKKTITPQTKKSNYSVGGTFDISTGKRIDEDTESEEYQIKKEIDQYKNDINIYEVFIKEANKAIDKGPDEDGLYHIAMRGMDKKRFSLEEVKKMIRENDDDIKETKERLANAEDRLSKIKDKSK